MTTQNTYRGNLQHDSDDQRENRSHRESNYNNYRSENSYNRFPEDTRGYSDAPSYGDDYGSSRNSYNSDTRRDSDAFNYRNSGGYGVENNYDRSGLYNGNARRNDDRRNDYSSHWAQDREHRTTRNTYENNPYRQQSDNSRDTRNNNFGSYDENRDFRNEGYNGRNASDYTTPYGERSYNPSENYSRRDERGYTYRHDEDYDRENERSRDDGRYSWGREDRDESKGSYGYYQSYPSYGQSESYGDHERYEGKTGYRTSRTDQYGETDNEPGRPNVRDRRSW